MRRRSATASASEASGWLTCRTKPRSFSGSCPTPAGSWSASSASPGTIQRSLPSSLRRLIPSAPTRMNWTSDRLFSTRMAHTRWTRMRIPGPMIDAANSGAPMPSAQARTEVLVTHGRGGRHYRNISRRQLIVGPLRRRSGAGDDPGPRPFRWQRGVAVQRGDHHRGVRDGLQEPRRGVGARPGQLRLRAADAADSVGIRADDQRRQSGLRRREVGAHGPRADHSGPGRRGGLVAEPPPPVQPGESGRQPRGRGSGHQQHHRRRHGHRHQREGRSSSPGSRAPRRTAPGTRGRPP